MRYCINGRFLTRKMTGVERYATELLLALDARIADRRSRGEEWTVLVPPVPLVTKPDLKNIAIREGGRGGGHAWEQASLPRLAAGARLINLANSGPVLHPRSHTIIHDAIVYRRPELFSFRYRAVHRFLGAALAKRSAIGTVSEFSRGELAAVLKLDPGRIAVVPNGSEHLGRVVPDDAVVERLGVAAGRFFLFVGSPAPHKNLKRALAAYASLGRSDHGFVIVGASQANVFGSEATALPPGAVAAGRLSDEEVAGLYRNASALVFPSLYEGFGIPPLEALRYGSPVLAADIPPVREVCADAVSYFDPLREEAIAAAMRSVAENGKAAHFDAGKAAARLAAYSWGRSADLLLAEIDRAR